MKFCYIDESGTGDEPYAVMVGILVDAKRMHPTKRDWNELLTDLSNVVGRCVTEIHTRDFYSGNSVWRGMKGEDRAAVIDLVFEWLKARKHHVIFSAVNKTKFLQDFPQEPYQKQVKTLWRFLGLHLALSLQKYVQRESNNKGHTVLIFDHEEREASNFCELVKTPPEWTDTYYSRSRKQSRLDQIVDVPYFGDSNHVALLQLADFVAYFVRRHIELKENARTTRYSGEDKKVARWFSDISERMIPMSNIYQKKARCECADLFHRYAPACLTAL